MLDALKGGKGHSDELSGYLRGEREVAKVYGLQGFTWADSLDGERLFLERI